MRRMVFLLGTVICGLGKDLRAPATGVGVRTGVPQPG